MWFMIDLWRYGCDDCHINCHIKCLFTATARLYRVVIEHPRDTIVRQHEHFKLPFFPLSKITTFAEVYRSSNRKW